jgi:NAD(P)-dependent dehydrogenase (short-subunit alcohol dehydrogenase family)
MPAALIVGASRGIGLELVRQYRADGWEVIATARNAEGEAKIAALGAKSIRADVTAPDAAERIAKGIEAKAIDVAIYNAGVSSTRTQQLEPPTDEQFDAVMHVNVRAPMRILPAILPAVARAKGRIGVLSSRMGSIGGRTAYFSWLYRASKTAVNSVLKDVSLVAGPQGVACVAFHPGWVKTDMGGAGADIDATTSVTGMRKVLATLTAAQNGAFLNYDGTTIPW